MLDTQAHQNHHVLLEALERTSPLAKHAPLVAAIRAVVLCYPCRYVQYSDDPCATDYVSIASAHDSDVYARSAGRMARH